VAIQLTIYAMAPGTAIPDTRKNSICFEVAGDPFGGPFANIELDPHQGVIVQPHQAKLEGQNVMASNVPLVSVSLRTDRYLVSTQVDPKKPGREGVGVVGFLVHIVVSHAGMIFERKIDMINSVSWLARTLTSAGNSLLLST